MAQPLPSKEELQALIHEVREGTLVEEEATICENNNQFVIRIPKKVGADAGLKKEGKVIFRVLKDGTIEFLKKEDEGRRYRTFCRKIIQEMLDKREELSPYMLSSKLRISWNIVKENLENMKEVGLADRRFLDNPNAKKRRTKWRLLYGARV